MPSIRSLRSTRTSSNEPMPFRRNYSPVKRSNRTPVKHGEFPFERKKQLMEKISNVLTTKEFDDIVSIVRSSNESIKVTNGNYEFDLEKFEDSTLKKLDAYVKRAHLKRVMIDRQEPEQSETDRRSSSRVPKQTGGRAAYDDSEKRMPWESGKKPAYSHPDDGDHYICPAMKKLRSEICFACGHFATTYNVSDSLRKSFADRFGFEIDIQWYTPNRLCGSCRSILLSKNKRARQFKFVRPMQWAPASNHLVNEFDCDCYFCKADADPNFFKERKRENLPQETTCVLPEMTADVRVKVDDPDDWTLYYTSTRAANVERRQRSPPISTENESSTIADLKNEVAQLREDLIFLCDKLEKKLDSLDPHNELKEIKDQCTLTNLLLLQNNPQVLQNDSV